MSFPEKSFQNEVPKENNWKITKHQRKTLKKNLRNIEAVWHYLINSSKFEFITLRILIKRASRMFFNFSPVDENIVNSVLCYQFTRAQALGDV